MTAVYRLTVGSRRRYRCRFLSISLLDYGYRGEITRFSFTDSSSKTYHETIGQMNMEDEKHFPSHECTSGMKRTINS